MKRFVPPNRIRTGSVPLKRIWLAIAIVVVLVLALVALVICAANVRPVH